ncbi:MAG: CoA transferase, partial [Dehalococcoidia bacterium]|nr:CoA transferase [Dehalococcoidia bacterium]
AGRPDLAPRWEAGWAQDAESPEACELARAVADVLRTRPAEAWERLAGEHDIPLVAVETRDPGRVCLEDEDMRAQRYVVEAHSSVYGRYLRHGSPQQFSAHELRLGPWEPVGGHARAILAALGRDDAEIERLIAEGVVEAWSPEDGD